MQAPTDLNSRIALAKGWTWHGRWLHYIDEETGAEWPTEFRNPQGEPAPVPDFVGTLEGVSGMLWELGPEWSLHADPPDGWLIWRDELGGGICSVFLSPKDKPGDCVGEAYMSVKEIDANTTD